MKTFLLWQYKWWVNLVSQRACVPDLEETYAGNLFLMKIHIKRRINNKHMSSLWSRSFGKWKLIDFRVVSLWARCNELGNSSFVHESKKICLWGVCNGIIKGSMRTHQSKGNNEPGQKEGHFSFFPSEMKMSNKSESSACWPQTDFHLSLMWLTASLRSPVYRHVPARHSQVEESIRVVCLVQVFKVSKSLKSSVVPEHCIHQKSRNTYIRIWIYAFLNSATCIAH